MSKGRGFLLGELPGIYRVQSVAKIPILRRYKYQARKSCKSRDFRNSRFEPRADLNQPVGGLPVKTAS